jgi:hypothetical protein
LTDGVTDVQMRLEAANIVVSLVRLMVEKEAASMLKDDFGRFVEASNVVYMFLKGEEK